MFQARRIAVVVPARNEERLIQRTLRGIPHFVDHIVVVDDASTDETAERVQDLGDPRVELVRKQERLGVGRAIEHGYVAALRAAADVICVMAGDNQMDPCDLESLVAPVTSGAADYVKGNRFAHPDRRAMPWARRVAGRLLGWCTALGSGLSITDSQCGYTAIGRPAAESLVSRSLWPSYGYPNDVLVRLGRGGYVVLERPVRPVYADEASGIRFWHAAVVLYVILRALTFEVRRKVARRRSHRSSVARPSR
jgi:glycosyltransferase involved in cell wall biosynthesis